MTRAIALFGGIALLPLGLFTAFYWIAALFGTESAKMAAEGNAFYWYVTLIQYYWPVWVTWLAATLLGASLIRLRPDWWRAAPGGSAKRDQA